MCFKIDMERREKLLHNLLRMSHLFNETKMTKLQTVQLFSSIVSQKNVYITNKKKN